VDIEEMKSSLELLLRRRNGFSAPMVRHG
jgi:hypothetical protein